MAQSAPDTYEFRLEDASQSYLIALRAERRAPRTISLYLAQIAKFAAFLTGQALPTALVAIKRDHVRMYMANELDRVSPTTVSMSFRSLASFFNWAVTDEYIPTSPMAGLKPPKVTEKVVQFVTDDEFAAMLQACRGGGYLPRRDEALLRFMEATGCRLGEVTTMTVSGLDLIADPPEIQVSGKSGPRKVYFDQRTARALDRWLQVRRKHYMASDTDALWLGRSGPMTLSGVAQAVAERGVQANIGHRVHPHEFRHRWNHKAQKAGINTGEIMRLGGWKSPAMVLRYGSSLADERAREAVKKLF